MADEHEDMKHVFDLELSERELHFIGTIVAQWGALENEIFSQTVLTFTDLGEELPKVMNNLQFSGVLELWKERVVESAPSEVKAVLEEQYQRILHYDDYRQALVHGMWSWEPVSPDKIRSTRIRKRQIRTVHMTADALGDFALTMGEINFAIRYPRGTVDLAAELTRQGGSFSRRAVSMLTSHPVSEELFPGLSQDKTSEPKSGHDAGGRPRMANRKRDWHRAIVPRRLYRFMRCDTLERVGYVRELLENRRLKYSAVTAFNDPFEARPYIRIPGVSREEQRTAFLEHLDDVKRVATVPLAPELSEYVQAGELEKARDLFQESIRMVLSGHPVACLAGTRRSILMWSLYADNHRGVCVHLSGRIEPLRTAWPIIYTDNYPSLGLNWARMEDRAFSDVCILTKSSQWRHEQEYRLISPIEGQDSEVIFEGEVGTLLPGSVTGLTLGALMRDDVADCLTAAARSAGLAVWRARRSDHEYRLMFDRLNPSAS